ncbi:hypothetical protein BLNAU_1132 [Blattamonas nauphoetae]|uniref:Uncharacterized protein n=1 Tax=Blattamonas nauphoetae TaxID=2049346 RepID=A0ABQ9YJW8_9EUKA|nr:hypothetical protein BLNAU_1132 [Blattamonas nauphoetae]
MSASHRNTDTFSCPAHSHFSSPHLSFSRDCSPFLNWSEDERIDSKHEKAVVFRSLVATLQLQPVLDDSLEAKAVTFLKSVDPKNGVYIDTLLSHDGPATDESLKDFIQFIVVLISSAYQAITTTTMKMLSCLYMRCPIDLLFPLVKANLIPHIVITLNPLSLSFTEAVDIHISLMIIIHHAVWHTTPYGLAYLKIEDRDEQQTVRETVLQQVLVPSEKYIRHLCKTRFLIIDGDQSERFLALLAGILAISPYYQRTMDFVLHMPVFLTITSCLTFFETESSIWTFLFKMVDAQREWNRIKGDQRQMWKTMHRMLRMEGIEDVTEQRLQNELRGRNGRGAVDQGIDWCNMQGMNLPRRRTICILRHSPSTVTTISFTTLPITPSPHACHLSGTLANSLCRVRIVAESDARCVCSSIVRTFLFSNLEGWKCADVDGKSDRSWRQFASGVESRSLHFSAPETVQINIHSSDEVNSFVFGTVLSSQHESSSAFVDSVTALISLPSQRIVGATIAFVWRVVRSCSSKTRLTLFKDDLIAKIIPSLNLLTLPFAGAEDLHYHLMIVIANFLWLSTPFGLASLELSHLHEHQALHETVLKQILMPSEAYLRHLCVNCHSIVDGNQSACFVLLLAQILRICPFHDPTFKFVQTLPIFLTLPNTLSFFEKDTISTYFSEMCEAQQECTNFGGEMLDRWNMIVSSLRTEGMEDTLEYRLENGKSGLYGGRMCQYPIQLIRSLGWNITTPTN